jgi:hypothetical protein
MASATPKRTCVATLSLHTADQSEEELLLSQELLDELRISRGCFVEIRAGSALKGSPDGLGNLVLQIGSAATPKGSQAVSVLAAAASLFGLSSREQVELTVVPPSGAALEWVEMVFRDQYLSRGDIWYWMQQLTDE